MRLILASASPRRLELLSHLTSAFDVVVSNVEEVLPPGARPEVLARQLAGDKAAAVAEIHPGALVLAADTIVVYRGEMLGKPEDPDDARTMLRKLRGRVHRVITGVVLKRPQSSKRLTAHVVSRVRMRAYTDDEIEDTIARGVPFDKAGGYGIQDPVLQPVQACEGCFCNVMGLPLWTVSRLLARAGVAVQTEAMPSRCVTCPSRAVP